MISQSRLHELFKYEDGKLIRRVKVAIRTKVGDVVGCANTNGYLQVMVDGKFMLVHRIVFMMFNGYLPLIVDHIDGDIRNNRIENLRAANCSENVINSANRKNTSGLRGVSWKSANKKWVAQISVNKKKIYLGIFDSKHDAHAAYMSAANQLHGAFAKSN